MESLTGKLKTINLEDDKYTLLRHEGHGGLTVLRHGEPWRNETGDKLILAMFHEIERLREEKLNHWLNLNAEYFMIEDEMRTPMKITSIEDGVVRMSSEDGGHVCIGILDRIFDRVSIIR